MSLRSSLVGAVPASTAMVARAAFPRGNPYMRLRDILGTVFTDQQFAALFPSHGQPAEAPRDGFAVLASGGSLRDGGLHW